MVKVIAAIGPTKGSARAQIDAVGLDDSYTLGDLSGTFGNPQVTGILGLPISATPPGVGDALIWNGAQWAPSAPGGGIGGTGTANYLPRFTAATTVGNSGLTDDGALFTYVAGRSVVLANGSLTVLDGGTGSLAFSIVGGVPTINSTAVGFGRLNFVLNEMRINGAPGTSGYTLTSQGAGLPPTWQSPLSLVPTTVTDLYNVDAVLGNDTTGDGSLARPYKTIQACLTALGNPVSKQDAARKITIYIASSHSAGPGLIASQANNFDGIYQENLWVPSRIITFVGPGVKIGNNGDNTGFGNITQEISTARRFGATSSELRHTMTFMGRANTRDTHSRIRNGIHIGGITRVSIIQRNIGSIQGDSVGGTRVTVSLSGGQNPYGVAVSPYASLNVTLTDAGDVVGYTSPTGVAIANSVSANQMVFFKSITGTTGPALDTYYYVVNATLTTFQLSTSIGGPPISLTGDGTGILMAKPGYPPFEDLVRFKVMGTTNYGTTVTPVAYDIIEKVSDTSFIAKRVTGTNTSAAAEATGTITETDSTGASTTLTHDMAFDSCYQQGLVVHDDGVVYSGAPAAGAGGALYAKDSRFNAGFLASGVTVQRWENSQAVTTVNAGATVASYSRTANVITVVTSTTNQWSTGQVITIANSTSGGGQNIDGTWVIATGGTNQFTLSQTGADYGSQTPTVSSSITALSMWGSIVTMAQATFTGAGIQLSSTPFTLGSDDNAVSNTRFGITRLYAASSGALPLARFDAYTTSWLYASGAYISLPVTFTDAGDIVTEASHNLSNGSIVRFSGIVNTTGISVNTDYYVVGVTANTFQVSATPNGTPLPLTTNGTGTMDVLPLYYPAFLDTYVPTQLFIGNQWVQTSSVTVANTVTETNLTGAGVGMLNFPANFLKLGRNLRISGSGIFSCTGATPTLQIKIKLGAVVIADTTAVTLPVAESNKGFTFDVNVSVRAIGASGSVFANGMMTRMATTLASVPFNVLSVGVPAAVTVNTTTLQMLTVTATWSAADPSNTITLTNLVVTC